MSPPPLTLALATDLLALAEVAVWHLDHPTRRLLAEPATLGHLLDAEPGPDHLAWDDLRPLTHPSDWPALAALAAPSETPADDNSPRHLTVRLRDRHAAWRWLRFRTQVVAHTPQGQPLRSVGLFTDVSANVRHARHLGLQQSFANAMATSPDRDTLAHAMLDAVLAMPDLDGGGLYLRDADGGFSLNASQGLSPHFLTAAGRVEPGSARTNMVNAGHMVCSFTDADVDPHTTASDGAQALVHRPDTQAEGILSLVVLPIAVDGTVRACLNLASTHCRRLPDVTVRMLHTLAGQFGLALERLSAREEAQHQRQNIEGFFNTLNDFVFVLDGQGRILHFSDSVRRLLGHGDELLGQSVLAVHPPRVHDQAMQVLACMLTGERGTRPLPLLAADGREIMVDIRTAWGTWNGQPALMGVARNITELVALQDQLALREEYQRATLDNFPFMVWFKDQDGRFLATNRAARKACDHGHLDNLNGLTDLDVWPADLALAFQADDRAVLESGQSKHLEELIETGGQRIWMETYKSPVVLNGEVMGTVGYARDITARKDAEQQLARSHSLMKALINALPDLFWLKSPEGVYLACNKRFESFFGHTEADIVGKTDFDFVPTELAEFFRRNDLAAMQKGGPTSNEERLTFASDGHEELVETIKAPVWAADGTLLGVLGIGRDITQRAQAEEERAELLARLQNIATQLPGCIYQYHRRVDGTAHFPYASAKLHDIYGVTPESAQADSGHITPTIHPDDRDRVTRTISESAQGLTHWSEEYRVLRPDGSLRWVQGQSTPQRLADGSTLWHGYLQDVTQERQTRDRLRLGASVFANSYEGIVVTDTRNIIVEVNPAFSRITGYPPHEVLGKTPHMLNSGRQAPAFYRDMWASIGTHGHWSGEIWNRRKNGEVYAEILSISTIKDDAGTTTHHIGVFSDITRLKNHEAQLAHIAHYDALTGLPNRRLLGDRMQVALAQARRDQTSLTVCMLDLDGFKEVNDRHGHAVGDELLVEVSQRLRHTLRENDTVARLGGDEFVVLMADLQHPEESHRALERLLRAVATPISLSAGTVEVSVSVGMTRYPDDDADADALLRHADQAMYAAKQGGKNRYHLFNAEQDRQIKAHREHVERLMLALQQHELLMHYQPKVNLRTGEVIGMEALMRWQHPTEGLLPPGRFLPAVQGHPFDIQLGEWVISVVLSQISRWQAMGLNLVVSANISATHLLHRQFTERLAEALAAQPTVSPRMLELEILETTAIGDLHSAITVLQRCRALGVRFALDDFGTGYSSLSYFRNLPVDMIKIDQSFVRDMLEDPNDLGIVDSVVRLAQAFNRPVIAEGVETLMHGANLLQLGCELAQGYGIAHPMPAEEVPQWVTQWRAQGAWKAIGQPDATQHMALEAATRSHHRWLATVTDQLDAQPDQVADVVSAEACQMGRWLMGNGAAWHGHSPFYTHVCALHKQTHSLASELLDHVKHQQPLKADALRSELLATSAEFVQRLADLRERAD